MKLDGDQVHLHGTVDDKSDLKKPFGCNKIALDSNGLKSGDTVVNEDQNAAFHDLKLREGYADELLSVNDKDGRNASNVDSCLVNDDPTHDSDKALRDFVAPIPLTRLSLKSVSFEKDSVFYIDKNVMEPEPPELVVCYKENTFHVIKDICIDEGVPSQDKFLFDTDVDEETLSTFLVPQKLTNSEIGKEKVDLDISALPPSKDEFSLKSDSKDSKPIVGVEDDAIRKMENDNSKEVFSLRELLLMPEVHLERSQLKPLLDGIDEPVQRPSENTILVADPAGEESKNSWERALDSVAGNSAHEGELGTVTSYSAAKATDHGEDLTLVGNPFLSSEVKGSESGNEEETLPSDNMDSAPASTSEVGDQSSCNKKVEAMSTSSDVKSSVLTERKGEVGFRDSGSEHLDSGNSSGRKDSNAEQFSGQFRYNYGETSFSAAGPVSGLISYSGPIAYSGSLSLRSDSSTTSARSFAFPVLQNEWNSSPVRMAKADRRHLQKHRGWRQGLLGCCRF